MERVRVSNALQNKANPLETIEMNIIRESWDGLCQRKKIPRLYQWQRDATCNTKFTHEKSKKRKQLNSTKELQSSVLFIGS